MTTKLSPQTREILDSGRKKSADRWKPRELKKQPLWHRQPGESMEAYQAFAYYLMLPSDERTHARTAEQLNKSKSTMNKWARQWSWGIRSAAYEEHYLLLRLESIEADRDRMWLEQKAIAAQAVTIVQAHFQSIITKIKDDEGLQEMGHDSIVKLFTEAMKVQRMAVLGRTDSAKEAQEANERLSEKWADELADLMRQTIDELNLTPEQKDQAQTVLARHLLGKEVQSDTSGKPRKGSKPEGAGRSN